MLKTIVLAIAALAAAAPTESYPDYTKYCKPATYSCAFNPDTNCPGWQICDVTSHWVYGGNCPPNTKCWMNEINHSPYCI